MSLDGNGAAVFCDETFPVSPGSSSPTDSSASDSLNPFVVQVLADDFKDTEAEKDCCAINNTSTTEGGQCQDEAFADVNVIGTLPGEWIVDENQRLALTYHGQSCHTTQGRKRKSTQRRSYPEIALTPGLRSNSEVQEVKYITNDSNTHEEALVVNPKQFDRILKRRIARKNLEKKFKIPKTRLPYLHESRHKLSKIRKRGEGGRYWSGDNTCTAYQTTDSVD